MRNRLTVGLAAVLLVVVIGCSPVSTGVKLGVKVVGDVVKDTDAAKMSQQLVGKPPAAADQVLGERENVLSDASGDRMWLVYPVKMDVLKRNRYVVTVRNDRIVTVQMVSKAGGKMETARTLYYLAKVKGKSPSEATASLGLGPPVLVVLSQTTGQLNHFYDASIAEGVGKKVYCLLRFDHGVCTKVVMVHLDSSTNNL